MYNQEFVLLDRAEELVVKGQRETEGKCFEVHVNRFSAASEPGKRNN